MSEPTNGQSGGPNRRTIEEWRYAGSPITWRVDSHCGVVKLYRNDVCLIALAPPAARSLGRDLLTALGEAATSVDRAATGGER